VGDPFSDLAERYNSSGGILRHVVRHELIGRGLAKCATTLAMRPALEGRYQDALTSLKMERALGASG
jgi:hypothetical protein